MLRTIVWYFSNGWLFLPFALLSSELRRHGSCMIWRNTASITERITVVLAIPDTTTIGEGGGGAIIHILAHITGKLVCIPPVTPDSRLSITVQLIFEMKRSR